MSQQDPSGQPNPYGQPISQPPPTGQYPPGAQLPPGPPQPPGPPNPYGNQGYPPYGPPPPRAPQPLSQSDERMWGMLSYLLALVGGFLAPMIIYLVYRERSSFVREVSKEALNLTITAAIVSLGATFGLFVFGFVMMILVPPIGIVMFGAWFVIIIGYAIAVLVFEIQGAMKANAGEIYRVPFILRLVK